MLDRIATMFDGSTILITGASGFLGKVLLEKILRTCQGVKNVYVLIRSKKGKTHEERLNDILSNVLFDTLKKNSLDVLKKCKPISGDVSLLDLGILPEVQKTLQEEVDFIFHSAATTRFDETVASCVRINVRGTKYMLDLAKGCQKLKLFVYVSTAYSHPQEPVLKEVAYQVHPEAHEVLKLFEFSTGAVSDDQDILRLMDDFPNAYSFSKALTEDLVVQEMETVPAIIVRPSIVFPIKSNPLPGWYDSFQGVMGILIGAGKGVARSMYMKKHSWANLVPADATINGILLSSWNYVHFDKNQHIYNLTASSVTKKTWKEVIDCGRYVTTQVVPFNRVIWCPGGDLTHSKLHYTINVYFFQLLPAVLLDTILFILGYKPFLFQLQKRIRNGAGMLAYYVNRDWEFINDRIFEIQNRLNQKEKEIYCFDTDISQDYIIQIVLASRRYIFKETDDMLPAARRNMKIILTVDYLFKRIFIMTVLYYFYKWIILSVVEAWF